MTPATTENEKVRLHTLNRKTGNRVISEYVDAETGKSVEEENEVKGYLRDDSTYVLLEDDELQSIGLESVRTIDIEKFAPRDSIEPIWYDKDHYLTPDDPVAIEAFSVIRDAMHETETVGISRLVMYRRERAVMLEPRGKGIILWTLRFGDEVRNPDEYFGSIDQENIDPRPMELVLKLIEEKRKPWSVNMTQDPVQDRLLEIISLKRKSVKRTTTTKATRPTQPDNVINIMDALRRSLASESKPAKRR
jgi:DNA end-binding protein Ku